MPHNRKYGEKPSHPIYVWNGVLEPRHLKNLGPAFPLFVWLIDRTTKEHEGVGVVLSGRQVTAEEIAKSMGVDERTIRRWMERLVLYGYIERTLTPHGYTIRVMKSCKFPKRPGVVGQDCPTTEGSGRTEVPGVVGQECPTWSDKNARRKSSSKQLSKQEAVSSGAALPLPAFWKELGIDPVGLSGEVRELCEGLYAGKNGQSPVEFLSACMDGIQGMGLRIPPQIAGAKTRLKANGNADHKEPIPELDAEPWGGKLEAKQ